MVGGDVFGAGKAAQVEAKSKSRFSRTGLGFRGLGFRALGESSDAQEKPGALCKGNQHEKRDPVVRRYYSWGFGLGVGIHDKQNADKPLQRSQTSSRPGFSLECSRHWPKQHTLNLVATKHISINTPWNECIATALDKASETECLGPYGLCHPSNNCKTCAKTPAALNAHSRAIYHDKLCQASHPCLFRDGSICLTIREGLSR